MRFSPLDAARLIAERLGPPLAISVQTAQQLPGALGRLGIVGGAVYDALVALAAVEHDATLATRDARARATYELVGARTVVAG